MDRVEILLSETLVERAEDAPTGPVHLPDRSVRRQKMALAVAASVVVIAIAALALTLHATSDRRRSPAFRSASPSLPSGTRIASYGQVSVHVPADLPTRTSLCGGPVAQQVVADGGQSSLCPAATDHLAAHPGTVVWFTDRAQVTPYAVIPASPITVDGRAAQRGYATDAAGLGVGVSGVVRFPALDISVGVTAPTRSEVDAVLATIVIAPTDPLGCAAQYSAATTTSPGPSSPLVPGQPITAVRCEYGAGLIASYLLDETKLRQVVAALNALEPDPCHCLHTGTLSAISPGEVEILYFHYQDGTVLRVDGSIGESLDTWTNRNRIVANYSSSVVELLDQLTNQG